MSLKSKPHSKKSRISISRTLAGHEFTISAKREGWIALSKMFWKNYGDMIRGDAVKEMYPSFFKSFIKRGALVKDMHPFIFEALSEIYKPQRRLSKTFYHKMIQLHAALIYRHIKQHRPKQPAEKTIAATRYAITEIWKAEIAFFNFKLGDEGFKSHYLTPGAKILNNDPVHIYDDMILLLSDPSLLGELEKTLAVYLSLPLK